MENIADNVIILRNCGFRNLVINIIIILWLAVLLSCSQNSWEGNVTSNTLERNDKGDIVGVTLILKEYPDNKFYVPLEIASGQLILKMGDVVYGLKPEGKVKIIGSKKNQNLIEVTKMSFSGKAGISSQSSK